MADLFINQAMKEELDLHFMKEALCLAENAFQAEEVPVGAVMVYEGKIIGVGRNQRESLQNPLSHAEIHAIHEASSFLKSWRLTGCTLYVTLEPCPMCAGAILNARIDRVVYGASDSSVGAVGSVAHLFDMPFGHRPTVTPHILEEECRLLLQSFFKNLRK